MSRCHSTAKPLYVALITPAETECQGLNNGSHFILDISFGRGVNDGSAKPFVSRVVPAEREHIGASNEEAAGSIDFYFLGIRGT